MLLFISGKQPGHCVWQLHEPPRSHNERGGAPAPAKSHHYQFARLAYSRIMRGFALLASCHHRDCSNTSALLFCERTMETQLFPVFCPAGAGWLVLVANMSVMGYSPSNINCSRPGPATGAMRAAGRRAGPAALSRLRACSAEVGYARESLKLWYREPNRRYRVHKRVKSLTYPVLQAIYGSSHSQKQKHLPIRLPAPQISYHPSITKTKHPFT